MLFTIGISVAAIIGLIAICRIISHPVNKNNFEHTYYHNKHNPVIDPWTELNYRHPRS
jgi:hypothetical protein